MAPKLSLAATLVNFLIVPLVLAAPAKLYDRAVSSSLLASFNLAEQYAAAAYCPGNNNSTGSKITCSTGNCPLVEAAGAVSVLEFENSLLTDVTGFVAVDSTNKFVVVSFRGSTSIRNYIADAEFTLESATDICTGCEGEVGFHTSWLEAKAEVIAAIETAATANPTYTIVVTGHSLGAAIATFCAATLRNAGYAATLYTFGSPRPGNEALALYISAQSGGNYRVTHTNDPVPKVPPILIGYQHIAGEYWITSGNDVAVTTSDITVFSGQYLINYIGGNALTLTSDASAHDWYFNGIADCYPDDTFELK